MSRQFPLAGLLRVRALAEERATAELAAARRAERAADDRVRSLQERLGEAGMPAHAADRAFQAAVAGRVALAALLVEQRSQAVAAHEETSQRAQDWAGAHRDVKAIERLEERHDEAVRAQEAHAEQQVLDEVAGRRPVGRTDS